MGIKEREHGHQVTCGPGVGKTAENSSWLENRLHRAVVGESSREVLKDSAEKDLVGQVL